MLVYRIRTESRPNLPTIAGRHFEGFTVLHGLGYWRGQSEPAAVIEVTTEDYRAIDALADDIRTTNAQDCVIVEAYPATARFVTAPAAAPAEPAALALA